MKIDNNDAAESELKKEIALNPNLPDAYEQLGELYLKLNRYDEAEKPCGRLCDSIPKCPHRYLDWRRSTCSANNISRRSTKSTPRLKLAPGSQTVHFVRGRILLKLGRREEAEKELLIFKNYAGCQSRQRIGRAHRLWTTIASAIPNSQAPHLSSLGSAGFLPAFFSDSSLPRWRRHPAMLFICRDLNRSRRHPSPSRLFNLLRHRQHQLLLMRLPDHLHPNRQSLRRHPQRHRRSRKSRQIRPLAKPHRVQIAMRRASLIISLAMTKRRLRRNRRKQNRHIAHLP